MIKFAVCKCNTILVKHSYIPVLKKRLPICFLLFMAFIIAINGCGAQSKVSGDKEGKSTIALPEKIDSRDDYEIVVGRDSVYYIKADSAGVTHNHNHNHDIDQNRDTLNIIGRDTTILSRSDTLRPRGSLDAPVTTAADTIIDDFSEGKKIIYYYGDVNVKYGDKLELKSAHMRYDMDSKTVYASGMPDSAGVAQGKPEMQDGAQKYTMNEIYYNFDSRKSIIRGIITQESEGFLHGGTVKKMPDNTMNMIDGLYTTCDHEHPHFGLHLTKAKRTSNGQLIFGPAYLEIEDVKFYFIGLPFGFVPKNQKRSGGLLVPSFNEEANRGFHLKGLGYYFVLSDHFDATLTADLYTRGSWNAQLTTRYKKRYKFNGDLSANYSVYKHGDKGDPDYSEATELGLRWSHSQDSKARPGTSFTASVNFSTPGNNRYNLDNIQDKIENQTGSSITYSKTFADTPFSISVNMTHNQNSRDSSYAITLPNISLNMARIYPFKRKNAVGKRPFYEDVTLSYTTTFSNKVNFKASDFGQSDFMTKFRSGMSHKFGIGLPGFRLLNYLQFSPSVSYDMNWLFQQNDIYYDQNAAKLIENNVTPIFSHFGVTHNNLSASLSASTTIYGTFNFSNSRISAIRHLIKPTISLSFRPDIAKSWNGFRTLKYTDANGEEKIKDYNMYDGGLYPGAPPRAGKSASMNFGVTNNVEAKITGKRDTVERKIKLIDNLSLSGGYNFLADSMGLSTISTALSTTIFGSLALNVSATLDPYAVDGKGGRINKFHLSQRGGFNIVRVTNASASFSYQFSGKGGNGRNKKSSSGGSESGGGGNTQSSNQSGGIQHKESPYVRVYENPLTGEYIPGGWVYYLDPENPWSINFNYSYSYGKTYPGAGKISHNHTQTLGLSGQLRLGPSINFNIQSGFDLTKMSITTTQLSATYDLHDFLISVSWVPTGMYQSWGFRINAKASALADLLKFRKNASYWDNPGYRP